MALLRAAAIAALLGGCYEPATKSCTVTCSAGDACADGQSCTGGFCVDDGAPACGANAGVDAPSGPATTSVVIAISGHGQITFGNGVVCDSEASGFLGAGQCTVAVPQHIPIHATAIPTDGNEFQNWGFAPCPGMATGCDFTPAMPTMMLAPHFK